MTIGILQVDLFIGDSQSLKEKRMILKSLKTRLRNNFNVGLSELDYTQTWQRAMIGVVCIGNEKRRLDSLLAKVVEFITRERKVEITDYSTEFL